MIKKRILLFLIITGVLFIFRYFQESEDPVVSEKTPVEINKTYERKPASIKKLDLKDLHSDQVQFNQQYPPPKGERNVAAMVENFETFDQVKRSYRIHDTQLQIGDVLLHESDYLTHPDDGSFDESLGDIVKSVHGYVVYLPNSKSDTSGNSHLYVDQLTWQPTIITGKLFVKYPNGQANSVAGQLENLGHKVTFHHENIRRYEVQVANRKKTHQYKNEITSKIPGVEVDLELKSYEHSH